MHSSSLRGSAPARSLSSLVGVPGAAKALNRPISAVPVPLHGIAEGCEHLAATPLPTIRPRGRCRGQPRGFLLVCLAVACERWAAYVLLSSVVLMLCERYGHSQADSLRLAGLMNAASYLGTMPGGLLADKALGHRRALLISTLLLALGYALLTLAAPWALWLSLTFLVLGGALFKPSTQAMITLVFPEGDPRLEAAQVRFYIALNAGAAIGSILSGLAVRYVGWGAAFFMAAAAMLAACGLLAVYWHSLPPGEPRRSGKTSPDADSLSPRRRTILIGALMLAMLLYVLCYGQVEGSLVLWAQNRTQRVIHGFEVPAAWFVALPALLVVVLGGGQLAVLDRLKRRIGTYRLVAAGLGVVSLAFVALIPAALATGDKRVSMLWLVACLTLMVVGELLIAPLGLALVLRLAPARFVGLVAGGWYIWLALGYWLAGEVGAMWARSSPMAGVAFLAILPLVGAFLMCLITARRFH